MGGECGDKELETLERRIAEMGGIAEKMAGVYSQVKRLSCRKVPYSQAKMAPDTLRRHKSPVSIRHSTAATRLFPTRSRCRALTMTKGCAVMASMDCPTNTTRRLFRIAPQIARKDVIVAHLGNGASMCAVRNGRSVASTMGFTALDGLPMGTRCGQLDPGVLLYLLAEKKMGADDISDLLYKNSGLKGIKGM